MMRHELYLENSYVSELETDIENINEFGVKLKNTIFYPRGGGQPEDKGTLTIQDEIDLYAQDNNRQPDTGISSWVGSPRREEP